MSTQALKKIDELVARKIDKRIEEIGTCIFLEPVVLENMAIAETDAHLTVADAAGLDFRPVSSGQQWGTPWGTAWFRLCAKIPRAFAGDIVCLHFDCGGECLVFANGSPVGSIDRFHLHQQLGKFRAGEELELMVEAGAAKGAAGDFQPRTFREARLSVLHPDLWRLYIDLTILRDVMRFGPGDSTRTARLRFVLGQAVDLFDARDRSRASLSRSARRIRHLIQPFLEAPAMASATTLAAMGHAHIDVAWLWPLRETRRKCGRTFSNVLAYMKRYPEFIFCQSQPQLYEFTREQYPEMYREIKQRIKKGQWIPTGGMWVEADCNIPSGESLVRQFLFGTRFFKEEFNHDVCCLWLPDVFGYSAALPQIIRRSGLRYFLTQKISWNQITRFPYNSFWWVGIDGSRVLSHFPPADTYNGVMTVEELLRAERNYREKDRSPVQALLFGHGDGGGGPMADMLERQRRFRNLEGVPKVAPMSPQQFFEMLEQESEALPDWVGELYLELHRGTLTTHAETKWYNRTAELVLHDVEFFCAAGLVVGQRYPQKKINEIWKTVLLNQFHDIIPGSSIQEVYEESAESYKAAVTAAQAIRYSAARHFARRVNTEGEGHAVVVLNSLSWSRDDMVAVPIKGLRRDRHYTAVHSGGHQTPVQIAENGDAIFMGRVPACGYAAVHLRTGSMEAPVVHATTRSLENECLRVRLDRRGCIRSIFDKRCRREVIREGAKGNAFTLFEDKPLQWEAWDVDFFYEDKPLEEDGRLLDVAVIEEGPVRAVLRLRRKISHSMITQDLILYAGSARLDFVTNIEWNDEERVLLKVAFPVQVQAERARYEIQFGSVERPTHRNTPQDFARFEVVGHKWADLSEGNFGVALLNTAKYGYDIRDGVMRLTLLRAPKHPDPTADINRIHRFTYSLLPHSGDFRAEVVRAGYELNSPLWSTAAAAASGELGAQGSLFTLSGQNVILDTVKKAEDDPGLVLRMYEAHGERTRNVLSWNLPVKKVIETNLMEQEENVLAAEDCELELEFGPYQIRTLKLVPGKG